MGSSMREMGLPGASFWMTIALTLRGRGTRNNGTILMLLRERLIEPSLTIVNEFDPDASLS